ncbi:hypothetical protein L1049_022011 [Liquidambar formosana]|uniref:GPI-anchored wall transfer protein 1 n=1 Tax=Liquidambar formosana TaxID=63359 RepID=A0AAP0RBT7_LIQFO
MLRLRLMVIVWEVGATIFLQGVSQVAPIQSAKSMMDLGVGSFVLANSLVSHQARNAYSVKWKTALQSTSPLIFLGFGRLVSTAGVDYQVHVGEYGVHWNFFFTLAAVSILTSIINLPPKYCGILGSLILIGYQIFLMHGLNVYLLSDIRGMDYVSQNKEGIFSIFGYWGMYLLGVQMGNHLFFGNDSTTYDSLILALDECRRLLTVLLDWHVERVSRRMCNLAYVTMVLAQNLQVLAILMLSDYIPGRKTSVLEEAFNQNLLGSFLLANVLTGLTVEKKSAIEKRKRKGKILLFRVGRVRVRNVPL